jgi:hypothetical protein
MAGAQMGTGPGKAGIYDPRQKGKAKTGKKGYWPQVQGDLNKQASARKKGKTLKTKKVGR